MKNWTVERGALISPDGERFEFFPISKESAERNKHAINAKSARERAVIFLRMLNGERDLLTTALR